MGKTPLFATRLEIVISSSIPSARKRSDAPSEQSFSRHDVRTSPNGTGLKRVCTSDGWRWDGGTWSRRGVSEGGAGARESLGTARDAAEMVRVRASRGGQAAWAKQAKEHGDSLSGRSFCRLCPGESPHLDGAGELAEQPIVGPSSPRPSAESLAVYELFIDN